MLLNIVLIPDNNVRDLAIHMSNKLASKFPSEFILSKENNLPHITLYQAEFPEKNIEKIKFIITQICEKNSFFKINLSKFSHLGKFIFWDVDSRKINELHRIMVKKLNPLRDGLIMKSLISANNLYSGAKEDIEKYGSLLIGKNYLPHLTITCLKKNNDIVKALQELKKNESSTFTVEKIHIGLLGRFGTVNKIIFTADLT